ncbi:FAD:protein FMN transferase [Pseudooceanicola nanhaiensis]|uniref:FAD:protein FMN transferase n=1 Tax=Pseudooceanicola nanhaiensis TaxID=375761 RepID=UPI001CD6A1B7|nr:FAD:protein FMN transferase [Pseudooceanicola nanhaiensis]MCA0918743.1 FAD:protein FMN transferase [Pseudooceanicola nanhaiensis]
MSGTQKFTRRTFLILSTATLAACKAEDEVLKLTGSTMGTTYHVVARNGSTGVDAKDLDKAIRTALADVNTEMSNWDASSEISRVNAAAAGEALTLSPALAMVMNSANEVHKASDGRFDVTVGPLIDLWGFGSTGVAPHIPSDADIADAMTRSGQERVLTLNGNTLTKSAQGAEIYLSAIGKGYGVDRVAKAVHDLGLKDFMVEIGGDLYASGRNPDGMPWQIGIESPVAGDRALHSVAHVSGLGMATSGDYRNFFEDGDTRYSHIIDPTTGRPITHHTVSTTVLTENAMMADAWATAMLVVGRERGMEIAEERGLAVVFIDREPGKGFTTTASSRYTSLQA